jgi:ribosomal protein L21
MKTKVSLFVIALISTVVIFSSCESKSGKRVSEKQKSDTLVFSPEEIGVTKLVKEFIPYPKYDGGTGIKVSFSIGIEYKGKTYQVDVRGDQFFSENITKEKAENDPSISNLILAHDLASNTPKDFIDVVVVKGEVTKLTKRSAIIAKGFYPTKIIWVKK